MEDTENGLIARSAGFNVCITTSAYTKEENFEGAAFVVDSRSGEMTLEKLDAAGGETDMNTIHQRLGRGVLPITTPFTADMRDYEALTDNMHFLRSLAFAGFWRAAAMGKRCLSDIEKRHVLEVIMAESPASGGRWMYL